MDGIFWGLFTVCFDLRIKHINQIVQCENSTVVCWLKSVYVSHAVQRNKYTKVYIIYVYIYIYDIKPIIQSYHRWK